MSVIKSDEWSNGQLAVITHYPFHVVLKCWRRKCDLGRRSADNVFHVTAHAPGPFQAEHKARRWVKSYRGGHEGFEFVDATATRVDGEVL